MNFEFLDKHGLETLLVRLKNRLLVLFASKADVEQFENDTNLYVTEVDYSQLEFDKTEIIKEE